LIQEAANIKDLVLIVSRGLCRFAGRGVETRAAFAL